MRTDERDVAVRPAAAPTRWDRALALVQRLPDRPLLTATLLGTGVVVGTLLVLTPGWDTNDDPAMMGIVSGFTYGEPSEHVTFLHVSLGLVLERAYRWAPGIPWYGLALYLLQTVAIVASLWALLRAGARRTPGFGLALGLLLVAFLVPMTVRLQFTSTAILLGGAGLLVHVSALLTRHPSWLPHLAAGGLLGLSDLVRSPGMRAAVLVGAPLVLWQLRLRRDVLVRTAAVGAIALAVVLGGDAFDREYYSSRPEWREYRELNAVRGSLHDTPRLLPSPELDAARAEVGWSANDLAMFQLWYFADADRYSTESLRVVARATARDGRSLPDVVGTARSLASRGLAPFSLAAVAMLAFAWTTGDRRRRWILAAMAGWTFAILAYLDTFLRLPGRVAVPLLWLLATGALLVTSPTGRTRSDAPSLLGSSLAARARTGALVVLALATLLAAGRALDASSAFADRAAERGRIAAEVRDFADEHDAVIVSWGGRLDTGGSSPLRSPSPDQRAVDRIVLGWPQRSPDWTANLERLGIDDLGRAILFDERVHVAAQPFHLDRLTAFAQEHYGVTPEYELVLEGSGRGNTGDVYAVRVDAPVPAALDEASGGLNEASGGT